MVRVRFDELRKINAARAKVWDGDSPPPIEFRATELAGEVGELCNIIKKLARHRMGMKGGITRREALPMLKDELGDVVICADLLAHQFGIDLGLAVRRKFNRTSIKHGFQHHLLVRDAT